MAKKKSAPKSVSKTSKDKVDGWMVLLGFAVLVVVPLLFVSQNTAFPTQTLLNSSYAFLLVGYIALVTAIFIYYVSKNSKNIRWTK
jgi:L-asparagine transporter-like permease